MYKTMDDYDTYCTEEQVRRAFKLSAPLNVKTIEGKSVEPGYTKLFEYGGEMDIAEIPTTQQMIGWLEQERNTIIDIHILNKSVTNWRTKVGDLDSGWFQYPHHCVSRYEAELASIDKALDYIENLEEKYIMENIFKNAKFGDKFVTRGGMLAIFLDRENHPYLNENNPGFTVVHMAVFHHVDYEDGSSKDYAIVQVYDEHGYRERFNHHETEDDIVSRYQEPIDENELNILANEQVAYENANMISIEMGIYDAFVAGYCKAKEG